MKQLFQMIGLIVCLLLSYSLKAEDNTSPPYLFIGGDKVFGQQLWRTDNTEKGTYIYRFLQKQPNADSDPYPLATLNGIGIFSAFSPAGTALFRTDGTSEGTISLKLLTAGHENVAPIQDKFFKATHANLGSKLLFWSAGLNTIDLNVTDGSVNGTQVLKSFPYKNNLTIFSAFHLQQQLAYFAVENGDQGIELWRSDGSLAGTQRVIDADQLQIASLNAFSNEYDNMLVSTEHALYVLLPNKIKKNAKQPQSEKSLWRFNEKGAEKLYEFSKAETPDALLNIYEDQLFWQVTHQDSEQIDLWHMKLDTHQAKKIQLLKTKYLRSSYFFNGFLYLSLGNSETDELWLSDLTQKGTRLLKKLDSLSSYPQLSSAWFTFAGRLYFFRINSEDYYSTEHPYELWTTDGTAKGTFSIAKAGGRCVTKLKQVWDQSMPLYYLVKDRLVFATFSSLKEDCLTQLWSLSAHTPEKPELLGEFDSFTLLAPPTNTSLQSLHFMSGQHRWQTDGTKVGTKNSGLEPLRANWKTESWRDYYDATPVLPLTGKQEGWIMRYYDPQTSGSELWWVAPNPNASRLVKDINMAPASAEFLAFLRLVGEDWYYTLNNQLWFIKSTGSLFEEPKLVEGEDFPNNEGCNYYGAMQDKKALYVACDPKQGKWLWQVGKGKAKSLDLAEGALNGSSENGVYVSLKQAQGFKLQHWQEGSLKTLTDRIQTDKDYFEKVHETRQGLLYEGSLKKKNKQGYEKITDYLWWQAKGSSERQLIYKNSKEDFVILKVLETEHDIYLERMDENVDRNDLVRVDLDKKRIVPLKKFSTDMRLPHQLYDTAAISKGIFIYTSNYHEPTQHLWFITDKTRELKLLKEAGSISGRFRVSKDICYFNMFKSADVFSQLELWMSQGTPETTRLVKQGVNMSYH